MPRYSSVMGLVLRWLADCSVDIITMWRCRSSTPLTEVAKCVINPVDQQHSSKIAVTPRHLRHEATVMIPEVGRISAPKLIVTCRIVGSVFPLTLEVQ